ncbi:hypothetical protein AgCh_028700 [Apium graveolens]
MNRTKLPICKRLGNVPQFSGSVDVAVAEGSGATNPEVQGHQHEDVLLHVGDQIVNSIEYPNEGPDEIHIGNVAVEDVIPEGIAAEEDLVEDPDENKERTAEELMTVVRATTRARMAARVALEDEELARARRIMRAEGVGPSKTPIIPVSDPLPEVLVDIHEAARNTLFDARSQEGMFVLPRAECEKGVE